MAVASKGLFATGVSTDLSVTYLSSGGKIGDKILAEVSCDKCGCRARSPKVISHARTVGKKLAFTSIRFHNEKNELVARGSHTK